MPFAAEIRRRREDLIRSAHRALSASDVFASSSRLLRPLVPFDAAAWLGTDPATGLPTSPVLVEDLDGVSQQVCSTHWQDELSREDVNQFRELARAGVPAASLRSTLDDPSASRRYRRFMRPVGLIDELRAVLRVGDAPWGTVTLWRREPSPPFTPGEARIVAGLSAPLGEALRRHARPVHPQPAGPDHDSPGLFLFDASGELVWANDSARVWLEALPPEPGQETDHGVLPLWLLITAFRAGGVHNGSGDGTARTRVRTRGGRWLVCHASSLQHAPGEPGPTAVVLEPAQPSAVAPLVAEAFDLSGREQEIVRLIARGASTTEMAEALHLSRHTVRDHVKAVFAKAGVSSRGELTAKVFAEFYEPVHAAEVHRLRTD